MSYPRHSETAFEAVIEAHLLTNGDVAVARDGFDRKWAIFPETIHRAYHHPAQGAPRRTHRRRGGGKD
jgi:hypothetical protein